MRRKKRQDRTFPVFTACACILAAVLFGVILLWPQEDTQTAAPYEGGAEDREEDGVQLFKEG